MKRPTFQSTSYESGRWVTVFGNEFIRLYGEGTTAADSVKEAKFKWSNQ